MGCQDCYPDCFCCEHSIKDMYAANGRYVNIKVIGCGLHSDTLHQSLAQNRDYCKDFSCAYKEKGIKNDMEIH